MKASYLLAAGFVPGILTGWLLASEGRTKAPPPQQTVKVERPAPEKRHAVPEAPGEARPGKLLRPEGGAGPGIFRKAEALPLNEIDPEVRQMLEKARRERLERRIGERLAALKERLALSPDQEAKIRALLAEEMGGKSTILDALLDRKEYEVAEIAGQVSGGDEEELDGKVLELLTDGQRQAYEEFRVGERENEIEVATYNEMQNLQSAVPSLTVEQKDQAFQALAEIARGESGNPGSGPEGMAERMQVRRDVLAPILTPEQMKAYEAAPMRLSGAVQGEGVVTHQIILGSPPPDGE